MSADAAYHRSSLGFLFSRQLGCHSSTHREFLFCLLFFFFFLPWALPACRSGAVMATASASSLDFWPLPPQHRPVHVRQTSPPHDSLPPRGAPTRTPSRSPLQVPPQAHRPSPTMGALSRMVAVPLLVLAVAAGVGHHGAAGQAVAPCPITVGTVAYPYANCLQLPGSINMTVGWSVLNGTILRAAFLSTSVGWAALAFSGTGSAMVAVSPPPVRAVVGLSPAGAPGTASAGIYELTARSSSGVVPLSLADAASAGYVNVVAARNTDGSLAVAFDRLLAAAPPVSQGSTNVLWAIGPPPQTGSTLQQHQGRMAGSIAFLAAAGAPTPSPGASPTPVPPPPSVPTASPGAPPAAGETPDASLDASVEPAADDAVCFPASATVDVVGRGQVAMADLHVGDVVAVGGGRPPSPVYTFSHADAGAVSTFVSLTTSTTSAQATGARASGAAMAAPAPTALRLSPGHYLPVNGRLAAAKTVVVGDTLAAGPAGEPATVTSVELVTGKGLYNPHTVDGGVLVDGIRASCYTTAVEPRLAGALLAPARWAVAVGGASVGRAVGRAVEWGRAAVAALPSGRDTL